MAAGFALSNGSSRSSDALLDEDMLGRESVSVVSAPGLELASDASSSESRAFACEYIGGMVSQGESDSNRIARMFAKRDVEEEVVLCCYTWDDVGEI